jgi:ATP-dependent Lhr-like helicase
MYDALMVAGYIEQSELEPHWPSLLKDLGDRALKQGNAWLAHERIGDDPVELLASRLEVLGPIASRETPELLALEGQGRILRGRFSSTELEWCDRRLLARIHRYTLNRLRAEIEPVSAADFMRFLFHWQHVAGDDQLRGVEGLAAAVEQLQGFELAAAAWENDVLPARVADYDAEQIDRLCMSGRVAWGRLTPGSRAPLRTSPIALLQREHAGTWLKELPPAEGFPAEARAVREWLESRGASFFHEIAKGTDLLPSLVERGLAELAGAGVVTADSLAGLRALLAPPEKRKSLVEMAGRWSLLSRDKAENYEAVARTLLKRYGVVFRSLLAKENLPPWRELVRVYRRLEARGEIRGGRFVAGFGGEQFAAPDAVGRLRAIRKSDKPGEMVVISAVDPLNLVGILTPEARVAAIYRSRILLRDGVPIAAVEGSEVRRLAESELSDDQLRTLLARRSLRHPAKAHLKAASAARPSGRNSGRKSVRSAVYHH